MLARILAGLVALLMAVSAAGWIVDPATAAANLGMQYLDGAGRSTQVGDFTAFFVTAAGLSAYGAYRCEAAWLAGPICLLGGAAVFRTLSYLAHGADFVTVTIIVEVVLTALLLTSAILMQRQRLPA